MFCFVSVRFTSQSIHHVPLEDCFYVTLEKSSHLSPIPVLGSFRASLVTFAPIDGFRPFGGHHHIPNLGGAQTDVLLAGAFTQHFLAFVTPSVDFKDGSFTKGFLGHDLGFS